jgi:hypothetical protein
MNRTVELCELLFKKLYTQSIVFGFFLLVARRTLFPRRLTQYLHPKRRNTSAKLAEVTSQKTVLFIKKALLCRMRRLEPSWRWYFIFWELQLLRCRAKAGSELPRDPVKIHSVFQWKQSIVYRRHRCLLSAVKTGAVIEEVTTQTGDHAGFEILMFLTKSGIVFWVILRGPDFSEEYFASILTCYLILHVLAWLTLRPWRWMRCTLPKRRPLSEVHGVRTQKNLLFTWPCYFATVSHEG